VGRQSCSGGGDQIDILRELFDWIADEAALTENVDWYCGRFRPFHADDAPAATLLARGGDPSKPYLRGNVGEYRFQVLTVGTSSGDYFDADALARSIHAVIGDRPGADLGEYQACVIEALDDPQFLGYDERNRVEISANYVARAIPTAAWWAV
jgi:hypothetical protein